MMTINFKALAAPIPKSEVKTRPGGGGKKLSFITARQVMNRLDTVCGPENWRDEYALSLTGTGIQCTLFIRIDGEWIGKTDVGTESNTEEDKGAYSDALKRAGVRWGIARELHGDGVADLGGRDRKTAPPVNDSGGGAELFNYGKWDAARDYLIEQGYADDNFHAYGRLLKLAGIPDDEEKPWSVINALGWTKAELVEKFTQRAEEKAAEEAAKAKGD